VRAATGATEQAPTLIFLHNAGTDHTIWEPVADLLAERFDTVLLNWSGYGERRSTPRGNSLSDYGEVLSSLLKQKAFPSVVLIGNLTIVLIGNLTAHPMFQIVYGFQCAKY